MIRFAGPSLFVDDMAACRAFYEQGLEQRVLFAVGERYTSYEGGMSLWARQGACEEIFGPDAEAAAGERGGGFELYFESEDPQSVQERLVALGAVLLHPVKVQPWEQRCFRARDPEGRLVEVGEPMSMVALRILRQGATPEEAAARTRLPLEIVRSLLP